MTKVLAKVAVGNGIERSYGYHTCAYGCME